MDMAMAGTAIWPVCANRIGRADRASLVSNSLYFCLAVNLPQRTPLWFAIRGVGVHTDPHDDQESGAESSEIHHGAAGAFHEIVWVRTSAADPIRQGREHVGGYDEEREVFVPEGAGEDHEEEADGEDLG